MAIPRSIRDGVANRSRAGAFESGVETSGCFVCGSPAPSGTRLYVWLDYFACSEAHRMRSLAALGLPRSFRATCIACDAPLENGGRKLRCDYYVCSREECSAGALMVIAQCRSPDQV
jgi:hypothetical protein